VLQSLSWSDFVTVSRMTCETESATMNRGSCKRRLYEAASGFASPVLAVEILSIVSKWQTTASLYNQNN